jgi:hypothetical protein
MAQHTLGKLLLGKLLLLTVTVKLTVTAVTAVTGDTEERMEGHTAEHTRPTFTTHKINMHTITTFTMGIIITEGTATIYTTQEHKASTTASTPSTPTTEVSMDSTSITTGRTTTDTITATRKTATHTVDTHPTLPDSKELSLCKISILCRAGNTPGPPAPCTARDSTARGTVPG